MRLRSAILPFASACALACVSSCAPRRGGAEGDEAERARAAAERDDVERARKADASVEVLEETASDTDTAPDAPEEPRVIFWMPDDDGTPPPPPRPITAIPARRDDAPRGSEFLDATAALSIAEREARIREELLAGNIPSFLRTLLPVRLVGRTERGIAYRGYAFVTPDYLAIGDDADFVRIPMTPSTAQAVADAFGCMLPTSAVVDAVYANAETRAEPIPLTPGRAMRDNVYFREHEARVARQLTAFGYVPGRLVAGHKKDVVIASRLAYRTKRVAIYGWHMPTGEPIQTLSTWHRQSYADYSHGVRLVHTEALIEGAAWSLADVMRHPTLWQAASSEGPMALTRLDTTPPEWAVDELESAAARMPARIPR